MRPVLIALTSLLIVSVSMAQEPIPAPASKLVPVAEYDSGVELQLGAHWTRVRNG